LGIAHLTLTPVTIQRRQNEHKSTDIDIRHILVLQTKPELSRRRCIDDTTTVRLFRT
jgi:hypothetical protein